MSIVLRWSAISIKTSILAILHPVEIVSSDKSSRGVGNTHRPLNDIDYFEFASIYVCNMWLVEYVRNVRREMSNAKFRANLTVKDTFLWASGRARGGKLKAPGGEKGGENQMEKLAVTFTEHTHNTTELYY